jgi:hypothetical protein
MSGEISMLFLRQGKAGHHSERSTPTRKKAARVRKADTPATVATHDNVIAFKPRRDDSKTRPL